MLDFSAIRAITIPEGAVKKITAGGVLLWKKLDESRLPDGYREVAYLRATGTQYINTGYVPKKIPLSKSVTDLPASPPTTITMYSATIIRQERTLTA